MIFKGPDIKEALPDFSPDISVLRIFVEALSRNGNTVAQVDAHTGQNQSFSTLLRRAAAISQGLRRAGVSPGAVVICGDKSLAAYCLLLGVMLSGDTAVLLNPQLCNKIHQLTEGQTVKAVFCDCGLLETVKSTMIPPPELLATIDFDDSTIASFLKCSVEEIIPFRVDNLKNHVPLVLFSSGATGEPKGVPISDMTLQRLCFAVEDAASFEKFLVTSPFAWISNIISFISSIVFGYTLICSNSREPKRNLQLIQEYKVNGTMIFASNVNVYTKDPAVTEVDLSSLTSIIVGGESLLKRVKESFINKVLQRRIGLRNLYGMTEVGLLTTWKNSEDVLDPTKFDSTGCLAPGVELQIVDEAGEAVGPGVVGEIWAKSLSMMTGYWGRSAALNEQVFTRDGFFRTGDAGFMDTDNYLYPCGRIENLIDYRGNKISVVDVEDVINSHPEVVQAVIVGKPDLTDSNHLTAFVVKKLCSAITDVELLEFVQGQVDQNKQLLGGVHFLDILPVTPSGKVKRKALQEILVT